MTATLNDLFDQILNSERLAHERKNQLVEAKSKIQTCEEKLIATREEWESQRGRQVLKIQQLNEEELKLKWLTNREIILKEQKVNIIEEKKEIDKKMEDVVRSFDDGIHSFLDDVNMFMVDYDLLGKGQQKREKQLKEEMKNFMKGEKELSMEVTDYEIRMMEIEKLSEKKKNVEEVVSTMLVEYEEKSKELCDTLEALKFQEKEKLSVSWIPQNESEFCRLRSELDHLMSNDLKEECYKLQQELKKLQNILRQKQIQKNINKFQAESKDAFSQNSCSHNPSRVSNLTQLNSNHMNTSPISQDLEAEKSSKTESSICETSNRLFITSYPPATNQTTANLQSGGILSNVFEDDIIQSDLKNTQRSSRSSVAKTKVIFNPKRKKLT